MFYFICDRSLNEADTPSYQRASLAGLVLSFIACFILFVIAL